MRADTAVQSYGALTRFATTRWNLIRQRRDAASPSHIDPSLTHICHVYWRPIFTFIYRRGYSAADAQDLTQDFFMVIMEGKLWESADPARGRFRSLLLKSLKNFLSIAAAKNRRHKRGGGVQFVSLEQWMLEAPPQLSMPLALFESYRPEVLFDAGWAAAVAEEALRGLRTECESKGRRRVFEVLHRYLGVERSEIRYENLSRSLGVPEASVKRLLHQFRARYRALLREEISKTLQSEANVDDEVRYLCAILCAEPG